MLRSPLMTLTLSQGKSTFLVSKCLRTELKHTYSMFKVHGPQLHVHITLHIMKMKELVTGVTMLGHLNPYKLLALTLVS